jgi:DNA-binding LacI/PurR family transcriptional regulator
VIPESGHNLDQIFLAELRRHGLSAKPYWVCNVARDSGPRSVSDALRLLLELDGEKRPDGLILGDDNTVEAAAAGMMSSSLRVGQDFDVVAHCNFPDPVGANFAFARLGYDCRQMIRLALERLDARRRGEKADGLTLIEPVFEWERRSAPRTD